MCVQGATEYGICVQGSISERKFENHRVRVIRCSGNVPRMVDTKNVLMLVRKSEGKTPIGRPMRRRQFILKWVLNT
jgi:hypothetical protein